MIRFIFRNSWWVKRERPKIRIGFSLFDFIIGIAGFAAVVAMWITLLVTYFRLPDVIPIHYNGVGEADHFGSKSNIIILPVIATVLFAAMIIFSRFPHLMNYPVKITENNASFQYGNMARMIRCLSLALVLIFEYIFLHTVMNTGENTGGLGIWFTPVFLAIIVIPVIYFMVRSFIYR